MDYSPETELNTYKQLIYFTDLSLVVEKLIQTQNWPKKAALEAEKQYLNLSILSRKIYFLSWKE